MKRSLLALAVLAALTPQAFGAASCLAIDSGGSSHITADHGATWTQQGSGGNTGITAVTAGAGTAVSVQAPVLYAGALILAGGIVSGSASVETSSDSGVTWTAHSPSFAATAAVTGLAYNGSIFVAVGGIGTTSNISTSPDGFTWTTRTSPIAKLLFNVTWGAGASMFVAAGTGAFISSPDGITWTTRTNPLGSTSAPTTVIYDGSVFAAISSVSANILTSSDGITWSQLGNVPAAASFGLGFGGASGYVRTAGAAAWGHSATMATGSWSTGSPVFTATGYTAGFTSVLWDGTGFLVFEKVSTVSGLHNWLFTSTSGTSWTSKRITTMTGTDIIWGMGCGTPVASGQVMTWSR